MAWLRQQTRNSVSPSREYCSHDGVSVCKLNSIYIESVVNIYSCELDLLKECDTRIN